MVSCQKGPTGHAYAWQIGPFWQDTIDMKPIIISDINLVDRHGLQVMNQYWVVPAEMRMGAVCALYARAGMETYMGQ